MSNLNIPSLDLNDFIYGDEKKKQKFIQELGTAYETVGFVAIKNHRLSDDLVEKLYNSVKEFFNLPQETKDKYDIPGGAGQRGYTGKNKEHAKGRNIGDLKEFYHVGQVVQDDDPVKALYPENIWPEEVPEFKEYTLEAYQKLELTGLDMLKAIAIYLELPEDYFYNKVHNGNSILRPLHYFPIEDPDSIPEGAVRAAEHEDINLITLLMGASAEGLQIKTNDGRWLSVTALPEQIIVNVGDMLSRLTNDKLRSTTHRVVNPPREKMKSSRYSIPFFLHPKPGMDLSCLPACIDDDNVKKYEDITAGEYLDQRLRELGLKA